MAADTPPAGNRHIRLTSHPGQGTTGGAPPIHWGAADPQRTRARSSAPPPNRGQRNVVGTHSGSYGGVPGAGGGGRQPFARRTAPT